MAKRKQFNDPLENIDPIMEQAFSGFTEQAPLYSSLEPEKPAKTSAPILQTPEPMQIDEPTPTTAALDTPEISEIQFPTLQNEPSGKRFEMDLFGNIPVTVSVELGRSQISLKEVFELSEGSIIELERLVGEPLDLVVNGQVIAQGEVVAIDNNYGLRVTSVISSPSTLA
jgi:flagellar motor switch protein FliN